MILSAYVINTWQGLRNWITEKGIRAPTLDFIWASYLGLDQEIELLARHDIQEL